MEGKGLRRFFKKKEGAEAPSPQGAPHFTPITEDDIKTESVPDERISGGEVVSRDEEITRINSPIEGLDSSGDAVGSQEAARETIEGPTRLERSADAEPVTVPVPPSDALDAGVPIVPGSRQELPGSEKKGALLDLAKHVQQTRKRVKAPGRTSIAPPPDRPQEFKKVRNARFSIIVPKLEKAHSIKKLVGVVKALKKREDKEGYPWNEDPAEVEKMLMAYDSSPTIENLRRIPHVARLRFHAARLKNHSVPEHVLFEEGGAEEFKKAA